MRNFLNLLMNFIKSRIFGEAERKPSQEEEEEETRKKRDEEKDEAGAPQSENYAEKYPSMKEEHGLSQQDDHIDIMPGWCPYMQPMPMILTYALSPNNTIDYISRRKIEEALKRSFDRFATIVPVFFLPAAEYDLANIKVSFNYGRHSPYCHTFERSAALAHAGWIQNAFEQLKIDGHTIMNGFIHLNAEMPWTILEFERVDIRGLISDMESVFMHEIGHLLGLGHSHNDKALMYVSLPPMTKKIELTAREVEKLGVLYNITPIQLQEWKILTVDAATKEDRSSIGGGFVLWDGEGNPIIARIFPIKCCSYTSLAIARDYARMLGVEFLKMHGLVKVLVLSNFSGIQKEHMLLFQDKSDVIFRHKLREIEATTTLAKMGRGLTKVCQWEQARPNKIRVLPRHMF